MDVGAIVVGEGEGRLELAREVRLAVDRLDRVVARRSGPGSGRPRAGAVVDLLAVEPDVPVARRPRGEVRRRSGRRRPGAASRSASRIGAGQQRTLRSTSPQAARVESRISLIRRIVARQVLLEDAVELELLPRRDPQRAVADRPGQLVGRPGTARPSACRPTTRTRTMNW